MAANDARDEPERAEAETEQGQNQGRDRQPRRSAAAASSMQCPGRFGRRNPRIPGTPETGTGIRRGDGDWRHNDALLTGRTIDRLSATGFIIRNVLVAMGAGESILARGDEVRTEASRNNYK